MLADFLSTGPKIDETLTVGGNTSGTTAITGATSKTMMELSNLTSMSLIYQGLHLTLNAYDMDFSDEMKLVLNGKTIDHLDKLEITELRLRASFFLVQI